MRPPKVLSNLNLPVFILQVYEMLNIVVKDLVESVLTGKADFPYSWQRDKELAWPSPFRIFIDEHCANHTIVFCEGKTYIENKTEMKFQCEDWLVLSPHYTVRSHTVIAHYCVSCNKAPWNTIWCGITNKDIPNFNILQWLLLRLRAGETFRPSSSPLKSEVPEEHDCLSIKGSGVLRT